MGPGTRNGEAPIERECPVRPKIRRRNPSGIGIRRIARFWRAGGVSPLSGNPKRRRSREQGAHPNHSPEQFHRSTDSAILLESASGGLRSRRCPMGRCVIVDLTQPRLMTCNTINSQRLWLPPPSWGRVGVGGRSKADRYLSAETSKTDSTSQSSWNRHSST